jgi:hypothetical protein
VSKTLLHWRTVVHQTFPLPRHDASGSEHQHSPAISSGSLLHGDAFLILTSMLRVGSVVRRGGIVNACDVWPRISHCALSFGVQLSSKMAGRHNINLCHTTVMAKRCRWAMDGGSSGGVDTSESSPAQSSDDNDRLEHASECRVRAYSSKTWEGATDGRTAQTRHRHHPNEEARILSFHAQLTIPPFSQRAPAALPRHSTRYLASSLPRPPPTPWLQYVSHSRLSARACAPPR